MLSDLLSACARDVLAASVSIGPWVLVAIPPAAAQAAAAPASAAAGAAAATWHYLHAAGDTALPAATQQALVAMGAAMCRSYGSLDSAAAAAAAGTVAETAPDAVQGVPYVRCFVWFGFCLLCLWFWMGIDLQYCARSGDV